MSPSTCPYPTSCGAAGFLEPFALPSTGDYVVVVDPYSNNTGTGTARLYTVVDLTTPIAADSAQVPIDLSVPGRNTRMPFSGVQGQRVSLLVTISSGSFGCWPLEIWRESTNSRVSPAYSICGSPGFLEPVELPATDTYFVVINPGQSNTGVGTVRLSTVVDVGGAINPGGGTVALSLPVPGQVGRLTFTGTATYKATVTIDVTNATSGCWNLSVVQAPSTTLQTWGWLCGGPAVRGPVTLPADGNYVIVVDPFAYATGSANVSLSLVP